MDKIICIGKNYLEHAMEMNDGVPEKPVVFLKPPSTLKICKAWGEKIILTIPTPLPEDEKSNSKNKNTISDFNYECEFVYLVKKSGFRITVEEAKSSLSHVTLGLDMTNRTLQAKAKEERSPWTFGKVFPDAAAIGPWIDLKDVDSENLNFQLEINNEVRQEAHVTQMRFSPFEMLSYASQYIAICEGDILFTGTPKGIGPISPGDTAKLILNNEKSFGVLFH